MTIAISEINQIQNGVSKEEFTRSLQHISEQVRWMDQQLTVKVENNIFDNFQNQENEIMCIEIMVERVKAGEIV